MDLQHLWTVYRKSVEANTEQERIGILDAEYLASEADVLSVASQYYEIPRNDLIVKRGDLDTKESPT